MKENCQYGIRKNRLPFYSTPCADESFPRFAECPHQKTKNTVKLDVCFPEENNTDFQGMVWNGMENGMEWNGNFDMEYGRCHNEME